MKRVGLRPDVSSRPQELPVSLLAGRELAQVALFSLECTANWQLRGQRWQGYAPALNPNLRLGPQPQQGNEEAPGPLRRWGPTVVTMQRGLGHLGGCWAFWSHQPQVWGTGRGKHRAMTDPPPALVKWRRKGQVGGGKMSVIEGQLEGGT